MSLKQGRKVNWQFLRLSKQHVVYYPPIVQFVVIFRRFGLCRSNSSSLLVGSHVVYFSPMPMEKRKCKHMKVTSSRYPASTGPAEMRYLAISKLSSAPLWQSAPCLYRICSPDTQNNISRRIISLSLEGERERGEDWSKITNGFSHRSNTH